MLRNMIRLLLAFYISGLAYMAFKEQKIFRKDFIREVLTLRRYPGWSEFLASFAGGAPGGSAPAPGSPENERLGGDRGSSGQPCELLYPL